MPYYRRRRSSGYRTGYRARSGYSRRRPTRRRATRRRSPQKIVIQVVGGPAGGMVPISTHNLGSKGRRPLRAKY